MANESGIPLSSLIWEDLARRVHIVSPGPATSTTFIERDCGQTRYAEQFRSETRHKITLSSENTFNTKERLSLSINRECVRGLGAERGIYRLYPDGRFEVPRRLCQH
jgi:hypothetical protein